MVLWIILGILFVILAVLLLAPITLHIHFEKDSVLNEFTVVIRYMWFKIKLYPKKNKTKKNHTDLSPESTEEDAVTEEKGLKNSINKIRRLSFDEQKEILNHYIKVFEEIKEDVIKLLDFLTSKAVVFNLVDVHIDFGFEDAMETGIFTGILNGFVYSVLGIINNHSTLKKMNVFIQPEFGKVCFDTEIKCICRLKNVHIIIVVINILKIWKKIKKTEGSN